MVQGPIATQNININLKNFTDGVESVGLYNLCEYAIKIDRPINITGLKYGNIRINSAIVFPERMPNGDIKIAGFGAIVGDDDIISPIPEPDIEDGGGEDNGT